MTQPKHDKAEKEGWAPAKHDEGLEEECSPAQHDKEKVDRACGPTQHDREDEYSPAEQSRMVLLPFGKQEAKSYR